MTEKPLSFVSLVKLLETTVGHRTGYTMLDPFPCTVVEHGKPAIIAIQNAGKTIARHIGLGDLTFVISVTTPDENTGGHIELDRTGSEVFVGLSHALFSFKEAVLATLCHELCHKYLHVHGIQNGTETIAQEFLTDVAAVYLGLGKLMLNGCECQSSYTHFPSGRETTTTHTLKTGYISRECFAFLYCLVCSMRDIPRDRILNGLSSDARNAVSTCERDYGEWFRLEYRNTEGIERVADLLSARVIECQNDLARGHRAVRRCQESLRVVDKTLRDSHEHLREARQEVMALAETQPNPHLRFIACLEAKESVTQHASASRARVNSLLPLIAAVESAARSLPIDSSDPFNEVVECPIDGKKLRVPLGRRLLVTCPVCKYKFIANTVLDEAENNGVKLSKRAWLTSTLKAVLGRNGT